MERLVEATDAAEAGGERNIGHGQIGLVDELLGEENAARLRHRDRCSAEVLLEETSQLAPRQTKGLGQHFNITIVEGARLDQRQRPRHRGRAAMPNGDVWRELGPASQAGPKTGRLGGGGGEVVADVLPVWTRRADRPAIDAGRLNGGEDPPIEAGIVGREGVVAGGDVNLHAGIIGAASPSVSRFSDISTIARFAVIQRWLAAPISATAGHPSRPPHATCVPYLPARHATSGAISVNIHTPRSCHPSSSAITTPGSAQARPLPR